ncbi:MAG TPA: 50S ribosomal protein L6 [Actinomycetes bacterium]|nr:50S ribosomal protein L6 [Actinomycetes bacterium]
MSRIGNLPIQLPAGVEFDLRGDTVTVTGPMGSLSQQVPRQITVQREGDVVQVKRPDDERTSRALHGLTRSLLANMVEGVTKGFEKQLEIQGVGYRVQAQGRDLVFSVGYSHQVPVRAPEGISFEVATPTRFSVKGIDKQKVGQVAAEIRRLRRPDPYKGKGIRYAGEVVRRKAGKTAK